MSDITRRRFTCHCDFQWIEGQSGDHNCHSRSAAKILQLKKEVIASRINDQWVSVEDRLPECDEQVAICWGNCSDIETDYMAVDTEFDGKYWANFHVDPPTYWMPLPPLPKVND